MINNVQSVHALVRLLKSPTDPSGPSKIEAACLAWSDPTFRAANKSEVIGEWILTLLAQAKKTRRQRTVDYASDPIADVRYWTLLSDVLTSPPATTARPTRTWLLPLLNRFQVDAIIIELLALRGSQVLTPARSALTVLWPLAEKKISADALGECLGAVLDACTHWECVDDNLAWICSIVIVAYRNTLANAGNKKKIYSSFLSTHLTSWLNLVCTTPPPSRPSTKQLQESIYVVGIDTVFSLDALKHPLDTLFDSLSKSPSTSVLPLLPRLFASFLNATHRHRSALFITTASVTGGKEDVRKTGMEFVRRCWILIQDATPQEDFNGERWRSIIGVLGVVEKERLFVPYSIRGTHTDVTNCEYGGDQALGEARDRAVEMLENAGRLSDHSRIERAIVSIQLLDVLVRIEYDFIGSVLERVFSALINMPSTSFSLAVAPSSEFLEQVLAYHTKTRTVHTYTLALLDAVVASSSTFAPSPSSLLSAFPLAHHLPVLARALRTFLTPTQITSLATATLQAVVCAWMAVKDTDQGEKVAKKRRIIGDMNESDLEAGMVSVQARVFSFTTRIAGTVLSNLPSIAYTEDADGALKCVWEDAGRLGWTIIWDCLRRRQRVDITHGKKRKHSIETQPLPAPYRIVTSASLLFLYGVRARVSFPLGDSDQLVESDVETLLDVMRDETSDPALVLETIRTLFWYMWYTHNCDSEKRIETQPILTVILDILTTRVSLASEWSGMFAELTRDNVGLGILHVLTDRWIDLFDMLAPPESLERLISLLFTVPIDDETPGDSGARCLQRVHPVITSRVILRRLLQNAHFWELHNIRGVFLSSALSLTSPLSSQCFPASRVKKPLLTVTVIVEFTSACNVYRLLGYVPPEYFTRPARGELIKNAIFGDIQICAVLANIDQQGSGAGRGDTGFWRKSQMGDSEDWSYRLTFVRAFLRRMGQFLNATNHTASLAFLNHLLSPPYISSPTKVLTDVTLDLIQLHIMNLLRSQEAEAGTSISNLLSTLIAAGPFSQPNARETWMHTIVQTSILKLIERLARDFNPASLSDKVLCTLKTLRDVLESALLPQMQRLAESDATELYQLFSSERINAWACVLSLTRWLGIHSQVVSISFGQGLAASIIRSGTSEIPSRLDSDTCSSILRLLSEELWCVPGISHRVHLDILVGLYVVDGGCWCSDQVDLTNSIITQTSKKLSFENFSHLLEIVAEGIGRSGLPVSHRERLIYLGKVILHDPPQGTLKVIQNFVTRCFNSFADRDEFYTESSSLKIQYLEFTARHCSERPVALRPVDLGNIWSLLDKILSCYSEHDNTTAFPIFHHTVTIVGALIRLRRDLVVDTLPHLGLVLRRLMMLTREIRPQLGAKQSKIVTDTFPSWLSASQPISTDETRALARLLTSLTTKTVPRAHTYGHPSTSAEPQKAESLAKPFAKHASYVLVAYVDAFNDPLCIINAETRGELEPGLFALCEMVGEHSRDALMMSTLDSGGKTIMKSLWRDYEKQRYVGKG